MNNIACEVAVVGSGLAGLAAAEHLQSQGYNVKVIEAGSQVGGRVFTHHVSESTHFELGAFSFGNGEEFIWNAVHRFAIPIVKLTQMEKTFIFEGRTGITSEKGIFLEGHEREIPLDRLLSFFCEKLEKIIEDMPFFDALVSVGASEKAIKWLQANTLIGLLGTGFKTNSTHAVLAFLKQYDHSTSFYAIQGGNDRLPQAYAKELEGRILFNYCVQKIERLKDKCVIKGEAFSIEAQRVIFAIPLQDLQKIEITPPLSLEKRKAMERVPYTLCARISIVASLAISEAPRGGVFLLSDDLGWFRDQTSFQIDPHKKTVLSISLVGDQAENLSHSREEWQNNIDKTLSRLYPTWDPRQAEYDLHVWKQGYSYFPSDKDPLQNSLRNEEGRLHFAGEHTSPLYSSMNGAIESGIRTAKEILLK